MEMHESQVRVSSRLRRARHALLLAVAIALSQAFPAGAAPKSGYVPPAPNAQESREPAISLEEFAKNAGRVGAIAFDVILVRPISALALVAGCSFFAISAPLVAPAEGLQGSLETFVYPQYDYTVKRKLGEF
jgi:hypothetical protein